MKRSPMPARRKRMPFRSAKRRAELDQRAAVRAEVIARDVGCVGPRRGLPGRCGRIGDREPLEVHEVESRGTAPGSHLDPAKCVALCPVHHDAVTSAHGAALALAREAGLVVRPST